MSPSLQFCIRNHYQTLYACNTGKTKSITKKLITNIHGVCRSHLIMSSAVLTHAYIQFSNSLSMFLLQLCGNRKPLPLSHNFLNLFILIKFKILFHLGLLSISVLERSKSKVLQLFQTDMKYWTGGPSKPQDLLSSKTTGGRNKIKTKTIPQLNQPNQTYSSKDTIS